MAKRLPVDLVELGGKRAMRGDGWINAITGFGDPTRDKRSAASVVVELWDQDSAEEVWRSDAMIARIIERPPKEMTRRGWRVLIKDDQEGAEEVTTRLEELKIRAAVRRCLEWERAFGGAALFLGVDDGRKPSAPMREDLVRSFRFVTPLSPMELIPARYYDNPLLPQYGEPELWTLRRVATRAGGRLRVADTTQIHDSRLVRFPGLVVTKRQVTAHLGWGDSILTRLYDGVRDFMSSYQGAAILLSDFSQAVYKIKGLAELIARNQDDKVRTRAQLVDFMRSVARAILIDSEEDFERKATPVAGMPELLEKLAQLVAAQADIPVTILMGMSPAGLNATGESDIRNWYDRLAGEREDRLRDPLERIVRLIMLDQEGPLEGEEPDTWDLRFPPLWEPTEEEEADRRLKVSQADVAYVNAGVLLPEEVAQSRFGADEWSPETQLDDELREEFAAEEEKQAQLTEQQAQAEIEALKSGAPPAQAGPPGKNQVPPGAKKPEL